MLQVQSGGGGQVTAGPHELGQGPLRRVDLREPEQIPADGQVESRAPRQILPGVFRGHRRIHAPGRGEPRRRTAQGVPPLRPHQS